MHGGPLQHTDPAEKGAVVQRNAVDQVVSDTGDVEIARTRVQMEGQRGRYPRVSPVVPTEKLPAVNRIGRERNPAHSLVDHNQGEGTVQFSDETHAFLQIGLKAAGRGCSAQVGIELSMEYQRDVSSRRLNSNSRGCREKEMTAERIGHDRKLPPAAPRPAEDTLMLTVQGVATPGSNNRNKVRRLKYYGH